MSNSVGRKRLLTVMIILALAACFWLACAGKTHAAAKKTFYVPTKITEKFINAEGSEHTYVSKYTYYKTGLKKSYTYDGYKTVYKRNKNGWVTNEKFYNDEGEFTAEFVYKFKKGVPATGAYYNIFNGKRGNPIEKYKYKYNKKGQLTEEVYTNVESGNEYTHTYKYHSNGLMKQHKSLRTTSKYDKKGNITKYVYTDDEDGGEITTYKNSYNKKGYLSERVIKTVSEYENETHTYEATETYKYEYTKAGKPKKCTITSTYKQSDGTTGTSITMTTYEYKKVKVAKKYWKFMD